MAEFFDKMVLGINKGVTSVKEGSKTMVEKATLNTNIKDNENKKKQLLLQLGTLAYDLQKNGVIDIKQFAGLFNEVVECDNENAKMKERLNELESAKSDAVEVLSETAEKESSVEATFVEQTPATEIPAEETLTSPQGVVCKNCNRENRAGSKFCTGCGTPLA